MVLVPFKKHMVCIYFIINFLIILDGSTIAYTDLNLEGLNLDGLGDQMTDFEHLRNLNLNKNKLDSIDKLRNLKYLQTLEARDNFITDNYFMSESK